MFWRSLNGTTIEMHGKIYTQSFSENIQSEVGGWLRIKTWVKEKQSKSFHLTLDFYCCFLYHLPVPGKGDQGFTQYVKSSEDNKGFLVVCKEPSKWKSQVVDDGEKEYDSRLSQKGLDPRRIVREWKKDRKCRVSVPESFVIVGRLERRKKGSPFDFPCYTIDRIHEERKKILPESEVGKEKEEVRSTFNRYLWVTRCFTDE